jgi:hypothetical protein
MLYSIDMYFLYPRRRKHITDRARGARSGIARYEYNGYKSWSEILGELGPGYALQFYKKRLQRVSSSGWLTFLLLVHRTTEWRLAGHKPSW